MNDFDPGLRAAIDPELLAESEEDMRQRIKESLELIADGYFTEDELTFALSVDSIPEIEADDEELDKVIDSKDLQAWSKYISLHPVAAAYEGAERHLIRAKQAALDRQAMRAAMDTVLKLSEEEATDIAIAQRKKEIEMMAKLRRDAMEAMAENEFPV